MTEYVHYRLAGSIATIIIDDGKVNVMSIPMLQALADALDRAQREASVTVIRSARPGIFSAGFDLNVFAANDAAKSAEMVRTGAELALRLMGFPMPTLGILEGHAFPMGTFLLLACDVRIAARGPYKIGLNEVAIRITPPGFAIELARSRVQPAWLSRTVTLGEMFEPDDALSAGFLDQVVPPAILESTVEALIANLSGVYRPAHTAAKLRLRGTSMTAMRHAIDSELTTFEYANAATSAVKLPKRA